MCSVDDLHPLWETVKCAGDTLLYYNRFTGKVSVGHASHRLDHMLMCN